VRQAEELLYTAEANVPELERQIVREENSLSTLLGRNPGLIQRGQKVTEQATPEAVPVGLPSQLLERRPDIQQAEAQLVAANANIGAAKAQLFPQISLSGIGGTSSSQLKSLFDSKNAFWFASGSVTQSIFDGGKLRNNLRLSRAQEQDQVLTYQKTIHHAFQDVSDSLTDMEKYRTYREKQEKLTASAEDATRLARIRYNGGSTSYLEVLTNGTTYFSDGLALVNAQANEALSLLQFYSALGGGWQ
jgi:outer membrane protein, multidrug efflux system